MEESNIETNAEIASETTPVPEEVDTSNMEEEKPVEEDIKIEKTKKPYIGASVNKELFTNIENKRKAENISRAELIRKAVIKYIGEQ